jgi:large subunit ribosomal protein L7/L12
MPQCTRCHKTVAPSAERCPHCGAWLSQLDDTPGPSHDSLEELIRSLLSQGQIIPAIKLYREQTGVGLAEAKAAVEQIGRGESFSDQEAVGADNQGFAADLEKPILELLVVGKKIAAIKLYRERTGLGLKDAKDAVEALAARHGIVSPARSGCFGVVALLVLVVGWMRWLGR